MATSWGLPSKVVATSWELLREVMATSWGLLMEVVLATPPSPPTRLPLPPTFHSTHSPNSSPLAPCWKISWSLHSSSPWQPQTITAVSATTATGCCGVM